MRLIRHFRRAVAVLPVVLIASAIAAVRPSNHVAPADPGATDRSAPTRRQTIQSNDDVEITISDLAGPGAGTVKRVAVGAAGTIRLPFIDAVKAAGLTPAELEQVIVNAYHDAHLIQQAQVSVKVAGILPGIPPSPPPLSDEQRKRLRELEQRAEKEIEVIQGRQIEEMAKLSVERDDKDPELFWRKIAELHQRMQAQIDDVCSKTSRESEAVKSAGRAPATGPGKKSASGPGA